MIEAYLSNTGNGQRVAIMLEETALDHRIHYLNLFKREHKRAEYLAINPAGLIPAIIDDFDGQSTIVTQTAAILVHLANRAQMLLPTDLVSFTKAIEWLFFQVNELTATVSHSAALMRQTSGDDRAKVEAIVPMLKDRAMEAYRLMDVRLGETPYLAGANYSMVDIMAYPMAADFDHPDFASLQNIAAWRARIANRPAVEQALEKLRSLQPK